MLAPKLRRGDQIRVIAPSRSMSIISQEVREIAKERLENLGLRVSYADNVDKVELLSEASVSDRVKDIHAAFEDDSVKGVFSAIGGFNSNHILEQLDFDLIKANPKVVIGFSDITVILNAITTICNFVTYYGPHYSTFGMKRGIDYTIDMFRKATFGECQYEIEPAEKWSDDLWFLDQENRNEIDNPGHTVINPGKAEGQLVGGNVFSFGCLFGTKYMPSLAGKILLLECDDDCGQLTANIFNRTLQSLLQQPKADQIKALLIGRSQIACEMDATVIKKIILATPQLSRVPVVYGVDFGHTTPQATLPLGGNARVEAGETFNFELISR